MRELRLELPRRHPAQRQVIVEAKDSMRSVAGGVFKVLFGRPY
jgi:hypothetical protein